MTRLQVTQQVAVTLEQSDVSPYSSTNLQAILEQNDVSFYPGMTSMRSDVDCGGIYWFGVLTSIDMREIENSEVERIV